MWNTKLLIIVLLAVSQLGFAASPKHKQGVELSTGAPKDAIPALTNPKFIPASKAEYLKDSDIVLGVSFNKQKKAYPLRIMVWHEIVNDNIGNKPILITYCPLCGTGIGYERVIKGKVYEFGVSGKLYNSDLVMYDRITNSLWSEILGEAIAGELTGTKLIHFPLMQTTWQNWKNLHPDSLVLSKDTGYARDYANLPYQGYEESERIMFPVGHTDTRFSPKERVLGLSFQGVHKAYPFSKLAKAKVINDKIEKEPILILFDNQSETALIYKRKVGGVELRFTLAKEEGFFVTDDKTGSLWNIQGKAVQGKMKEKKLEPIPAFYAYWFAWVAFYPETLVY
jgi:hypothetical protein